MFPPLQDLYRIAPELVLCAFGMLVMFLSPIVPKSKHGALEFIALLGAALALGATWLTATHSGAAYSGLFRADAFSDSEADPRPATRDVILFADTFNRYFEPENLRAAIRVLRAAGFRAILPKSQGRPLCCGRTYLSAAAGFVEQFTGWPLFFVICVLVAVPSLILLAWLQRRGHFAALGPIKV